MADNAPAADPWASVATPAPAADPWDAVATPAPAAQLPDPSPIQGVVQDNLSKQEPQADQSPQQKLDSGLGFSATSVLKGGDQDKPLPEPIRGAINDSYASRTSRTAGDYMHLGLRIAAHIVTHGASDTWTSADVGAAGRSAALAQPANVGGIAGAGAAVTLAAPVIEAATALGGPIAGAAVGAAAGFGGAIAGAEPVQGVVNKLLDTFPDLADKIGIGKAQLAEDSKHPTSQFVGNLLSNLPHFTPGMADKLHMAVNAAIGGGQETVREWNSDEKMSAAKILAAAGVMAISNNETKLGRGVMGAGEAAGAKINSGYEALKPIISNATGVHPDAVTPEHTDQTIAAGFDNVLLMLFLVRMGRLRVLLYYAKSTQKPAFALSKYMRICRLILRLPRT